jgi:hypothetical protein
VVVMVARVGDDTAMLKIQTNRPKSIINAKSQTKQNKLKTK